MQYKTELHAHSATVSPCASVTPEQLILRYLEEGYTSLVLTEHYCDYVIDPAGATWEEKIGHYLSGYRVLKRAAEGANLNGLDDVLNGTTALALSNDYVAAAKILCKYAEDNKNFTVKAGFMDGEVIGADKVIELSKLPSKEGLLSMLLSVLNGPIRGLAVALNAIAEKEPAAEDAAAPAEAAPVEAAPAEEAAPAAE